jgi:hypothetical protein
MKKLIVFIFATASLLSACKKEEGKGGRALIKGKVYAEYWDKAFNLKADSGYAPDVDVYIMYGDQSVFGDRTKASFDGSYEFNYLQKGDYKIYAYSRDSSGKAASASTGDPNYLYNPDRAVIKSVKVSDRKETVEVDEIRILK